MIHTDFSVVAKDKQPNYAKLVIGPLEQGYGYTLGNAIRRVLLSSLPGYAIHTVKISGVNHQFTTLSGMKEDVVELILALKQIRLKSTVSHETILRIDVKGVKEVTAADITTEGGVEVVNTDLHLATLTDAKTAFTVEMKADVGQGYVMAADREVEGIGVIPIDALYSPVQKVSYQVRPTRVGRRTDFDELNLEVWTDGSIEPKIAVQEAAKLLVGMYARIASVDPDKALEEQEQEQLPAPVVELQQEAVLFEETSIPPRIANALQKHGYENLKDLAAATKEEVSKVKNLGEKSLELVIEEMNKHGLEFQG